MTFLAVAVSFTMRTCLAITITEMVAPSNSTRTNHSAICSANRVTFNETSAQKIHKDSLKFDWTQEQQGWILSSFYVGYLLAHIPAGALADKFGGKWTVSMSVLITSICNALTPHAVAYGPIECVDL